MCNHLIELDKKLKSSGYRETYRGEAWSINCREWVYYDCFLDTKQIQQQFDLPDFVVEHSNDDPKSGLEFGLVCLKCNDAVMGIHTKFANGSKAFPEISLL